MAPLSSHAKKLIVLSCISTTVFAYGGSRSVWPPSAYVSANATLAQLSLQEKIGLVSGMNGNYQKCADKTCAYVGWIAGVPRLDISDIYLEDGPQGVADGMLNVTQWPSAMTVRRWPIRPALPLALCTSRPPPLDLQVAQAWDPALFETWGAAMGVEQAAKGSNVMLGPAVALVRVPYSGRNFEYYSEDPFFNAALAGAMVRGIQSNSLSACVKHWIFNSQVSGGRAELEGPRRPTTRPPPRRRPTALACLQTSPSAWGASCTGRPTPPPSTRASAR